MSRCDERQSASEGFRIFSPFCVISLSALPSLPPSLSLVSRSDPWSASLSLFAQGFPTKCWRDVVARVDGLQLDEDLQTLSLAPDSLTPEVRAAIEFRCVCWALFGVFGLGHPQHKRASFCVDIVYRLFLC